VDALVSQYGGEMCDTVVRVLACVLLQLPFGGRPCPSLWNDFLKTITGLSNAIVNDESGDPDKLCSPLQHLIPQTVAEPDGILFEQALPMSITILYSDSSYNWTRTARTNQTFY
jgi:hypothetical protein